MTRVVISSKEGRQGRNLMKETLPARKQVPATPFPPALVNVHTLHRAETGVEHFNTVKSVLKPILLIPPLIHIKYS